MAGERFSLQVFATGAAFEDAFQDELARALRVVADRVEAGVTGGRVRDANGNSVGTWSIDRD